MVNRLIDFSGKHRVLVIVGVALATAASVWSAQRIKLDAIPDLSDPQVIVFTEWMGRSPSLIEDQVTYPIVAGLLNAPHVTDVRGYSMFGMSFVYVLFEEGTDLYWARSRVLEYMGGLQGRLPAGVTPTLGPDATGVGWVFQYVLEDKSGRHGLDELRTFQDFTLRYALGSVKGVAEVASVGGYQKQYQVTVDPLKLKAYGVTLQEVSDAISDSNQDVGGRSIEMSGREYYVRGQGYVQDLGDLERVVVRTSGPAGTPVLVKDVGSVKFGPDLRRGLLEWNGDGEAVGGIVVMRHGENALDVIDRVKARIEELKQGMPEGVEIAIGYDRSDLIDRSIDTLKSALVEEIIVVSLIIIVFLLHFRSALLPILSLPIAVSLSFIPMYLLDIPGTIMSLGGIAIAIGATVDAEIVMVEASHKALERAKPGADRRKLLADAAKEVTPAIFFSLVIIAVAFLPVFTLTGQAGRMFKPLAWTKTFVMIASALLSVTFAPAMRDYLIRGKIFSEKNHPISRFIVRIYEPFVFVALRNPKSTVAMGLLAVLSAVPVGMKLGSEFMPPLNEGDILYMPMTFPNISIEEVKHQLQAQDRVFRSFPEVASVYGKAGRAETATDPAPLEMVETTVRLKPQEQWRKVPVERWYSGWAPDALKSVLGRVWPEERTITWDELITQMNDAMQFPGWTNAYTMPIKTRIDMLSTGVRTPVGVKILGPDLNGIERIGPVLESVISQVPGTRSALYERSLGGFYVDIVPDREALARYGLRVGDVARIIEAAIGGAPVTTTVEGRARFSVNVRYPQDLRNDVEKLKRVLVPVVAGAGMGGGMEQGTVIDREPSLVRYAQNMAGMSAGNEGGSLTPIPGANVMSDAPGMGMLPMPMPQAMSSAPMGDDMAAPPAPAPAAKGVTYVPLGQLADVKVASGPPMIRDENGALVGYLYVDIDLAERDLGGFVNDARAAVDEAIASGTLSMPPGYRLEWTGQYEHLQEMNDRMKIAIPAALLIILFLLYLHFRNIMEVLIVLLSIPFALVGSVWLMWLLDYRLSTAVWVGVIALVGLAAQTGIVMIVYIDHAFERRKAAGKIRDLNDIIWAHMEGTVQRVRPKLMTVTTMLAGLVPLLWATGSGADVMRRIAAPMVGGLITSAFLTLEIIPAIYTYWRLEELMWERLQTLAAAKLKRLRTFAYAQAAGWTLLTATLLSAIYVALPQALFVSLLAVAGVVVVVATVGYLIERPAAKRLVWPAT